MKIEQIKASKLKPATYNPRQISTKQYKDLSKSIATFGLVDPIIINKDFTVIGGHQRLKVLNEMQTDTIPCVVLDLSKEKERELNVRLKKNTGDFDIDILANEFDIDELVDWGFKHIDLGLNIDKIGGNIEDDHIPEVKESRVKLGDVWQLGKHRVMCGDSTKESDVEKLMNGEKADLLLTDPPYGISATKMTLGTGKKEFHRGDWDNDKPDITLFLKYCDKQIIWGGNYFADVLPVTNDWLCWHKKNDGLSFSEFELAWSNIKKNCRILSHHWGGEKKKHPTQKPLEVIKWCIELEKDAKTILDVFLGSGTTLIACEKTNRICYGMELDTKYCDVIIERWEQFTGQKATKL